MGWFWVGWVALAGCVSDGGGGPATRQLEIDHYRAPCVGESAQLCLRVREVGQDWELLYDRIEGFAWDWGTTSVVTIEVTEVEDPPADASSLAYRLVSLEEARDVAPGTAFALSVPDATPGLVPFLQVTADGGALLDQRAFTCAAPEVCTALSAAVETGHAFSVQFAYADPIDGPLVATSVE